MESIMTPLGIIILCIGFFNFFLAVLVFLRKPKAKINVFFALIALSFSGWSISLLFYQFPFFLSSLFWIKLTFVFVTFYSCCILLFSFFFPKIIHPRKIFAAHMWNIFYILGSVWLLFFTPFWVQNVMWTEKTKLQTILGPGYIVWTLATWVPFIWAAINFIEKSKTADKFQKVQMQYLWVSFIVFSIFVCIPDVVIPLVFHTTEFFYISPLTNLFFSIPVAYLILRHRFLDIRRIIAEVVAELAIATMLGTIYISLAYTFAYLFFPKLINWNYIVLTVGAAMLVRFFLMPLAVKMRVVINDAISNKSYDRETVIRKVSELVAQHIELKDLAKALADFLEQAFRAQQVAIVIRSKEKENTYHVHSSAPKREVKHSKTFLPLLLRITKTLAVAEELPENAVKKFFRERKVSICAPLLLHNEPIGYLIMYEKKSQELYTTYDITTIETIVPHIAVAVQNALYVEKIEAFNSELKKEVGKATSQLRQANEHLLDLDRLKDEFISMASHELRTPTTVIKSFLWILLHKDKQIGPETKKRLQRLYQLATHMGNLIKDMMDVSMIEGGKMRISAEEFDLGQLITDTVEEIQTATAAKRTISVVSNSTHRVYADKDKIRQVVANLISNAIKYTKENGEIHISLAGHKHVVEVSVADNGIGIKQTDINKLFTKFGKLHSIRSSEGQIPGSGLGLFITKRLIELSSGTLTVASKLGKGSTFIFTLPKAKTQLT